MTELATTLLTAEDARALTDDIRRRVTDLLPLITRAYEHRADKALGYATWADYCSTELSGLRVPLADRPAMVAELRQNGMSTRAIGSALGVDHSTVVRDLRPTGADAPVEMPERVTSLDGRERPAQMPARQEVADAIVEELDRALAAQLSPTALHDDRPLLPRKSWTSPPTEAAPTDKETVERERRQRHTRYFAEALVSLWSLLDPDPIAFAEQTWRRDANPHRDTVGAREAFTDKGLRLLADRLQTLANHVNESGGVL